MEYVERAIDDVDELFASEEGWDHSFMQLTKGPLHFRTRQVLLPNLTIEWNSFGQSVWVREVLDSSTFFFGFLLDSSGPAVFRGRDVHETEALVYQRGLEQEYRLRPQSESLVLSITAPLMESLDWQLSRDFIQRVPADRLNRLVSICKEVTRSALVTRMYLPNSDWEFVQRDRILIALRSVLTPWILRTSQSSDHELKGSRGFQLVKRAEQLMESWSVERKLHVPELAAELDTSERVLYESFRTTLGVGPYEYHLLNQMHAFHRSISSGQVFRGKITKAAIASGFTHMGRLTQMYKQYFNKTPRQTIKRRNSTVDM